MMNEATDVHHRCRCFLLCLSVPKMFPPRPPKKSCPGVHFQDGLTTDLSIVTFYINSIYGLRGVGGGRGEVI
jgi:hypothetical protein